MSSAARAIRPFSEFLGAEREHAAAHAFLEGAARLWCHPTFDTVGSALRLICDRLTGDAATCPPGVIVVPFGPEASWWRLTKHFSCVGQWEMGGST